MAKKLSLDTFRTWNEVLRHVRAGLPMWYHAPMDHQPVRVVCLPSEEFPDEPPDAVRVIPPPSSDADPFTADAGHLDRFRRSPTQRIYP